VTVAALAALVGFSLLAASVAGAHIGIKPTRATAGEATRLTFEVENEQSDARTVKVDVKLPEGIEAVSPRRVGGWRVKTRRTSGAVTRLTITAPKGEGFGPGEVSRDFGFSMRFAPGPARTVPFKTVQTYDSGFVARWIGPAGSEEPAPRLRLAAAEETATPEQEQPAPAADPGTSDSDDDDGDSFLLIAAITAPLVLILLVAITLWRRRREG